MFRSLVATLALLASASAAEPVQVHVTGATQADGQLLQDILRQVALYGVAFNCPAPSDVHIGVIAASRVPLAAEYRAR